MPNPKRGEVEVELAGRPVRFCLTFGALASLEKRMGLDTISDLASRFLQERLSVEDLCALLVAGLEGSGDPMSERELRNLDLQDNWSTLLDTAARLLAATFGGLEHQKPSPF